MYLCCNRFTYTSNMSPKMVGKIERLPKEEGDRVGRVQGK